MKFSFKSTFAKNHWIVTLSLVFGLLFFQYSLLQHDFTHDGTSDAVEHCQLCWSINHAKTAISSSIIKLLINPALFTFLPLLLLPLFIDNCSYLIPQTRAPPQ